MVDMFKCRPLLSLLGLFLCFLLCVPVGVQADEPQRFLYKDVESGVIFYVESDRRHVAAINAEGKILWVRNPFVDSHLRPYRTPAPKIFSIGAAKTGYEKIIDKNARFIAIEFDSSQFGIMDQKNGNFQPLGQN